MKPDYRILVIGGITAFVMALPSLSALAQEVAMATPTLALKHESPATFLAVMLVVALLVVSPWLVGTLRTVWAKPRSAPKADPLDAARVGLIHLRGAAATDRKPKETQVQQSCGFPQGDAHERHLLMQAQMG